MGLTHILVDFENLQPSAQDIAHVRGDQYRLWIFRGPQQKKFDADVVEAWQPLGDKVKFIQCEKAGRNALDMHVAFQLGALVNGLTDKSARFVVVSKDTDYEPLLQYIRALGYSAQRVANVRAAVSGTVGEKPAGKTAKAAKAKAAEVKGAEVQPVEATLPAAKKAAAKTAAPAAKQAGAAKKAAAAKAPPKKAQKEAQVALQLPVPESPAVSGLLDKYIKRLHEHPKSRPAKRRKLEADLATFFRDKKVEAPAPAELIADLERRGAVAISGAKVEYPLWG